MLGPGLWLSINGTIKRAVAIWRPGCLEHCPYPSPAAISNSPGSRSVYIDDTAVCAAVPDAIEGRLAFCICFAACQCKASCKNNATNRTLVHSLPKVWSADRPGHKIFRASAVSVSQGTACLCSEFAHALRIDGMRLASSYRADFTGRESGIMCGVSPE